MTIRGIVATRTGWAFVEAWGQRLTGALVFLFMAALLDPSAYGLMGMAMVVTTLADSLLRNGGWNEALIQRENLEPGHCATLFWGLLLCSLTLMGACIAVAPLVARLFKTPEVAPLIQWISLILPIGSLAAVPTALMRRAFQFERLALATFVSVLCGGGVGIALAFWGLGPWSLIGFYLAKSAVSAAALWSLHPWRPTARPSWRHFHEIRSFGAYSVTSRFIMSLQGIGMRSIVGFFFGPQALGLFVFARSFGAQATDLVVTPFSRVALSTLARTQDDAAGVSRALSSGSRSAGLVAYPVFVGLAAVAPELVVQVFGNQWKDAVPLVQLLMLAGVTYPIGNFDFALLRALARVQLEFIIVLTSCTTVLLGVLLASQVSVTVVAAVVLGLGVLLVPLRIALIRRFAGIDRVPELIAALPFLCAALLMGGVVVLWRLVTLPYLPGIYLLASSVAIGVVAYAGLIALFDRSIVHEFAEIVRPLMQSRRPNTAASALRDAAADDGRGRD